MPTSCRARIFPTSVSATSSGSRALLLAALVLATAGCSSSDSTSPSLPTVADDGGSDGDGALLSGTTELDGPCLYLVDDAGLRWLPVFREGTSTLSASGTLTFGDVEYDVGDQVSLGGGESLPSRLEFVSPPLAACDTTNLWLTN